MMRNLDNHVDRHEGGCLKNICSPAYYLKNVQWFEGDTSWLEQLVSCWSPFAHSGAKLCRGTQALQRVTVTPAKATEGCHSALGNAHQPHSASMSLAFYQAEMHSQQQKQ